MPVKSQTASGTWFLYLLRCNDGSLYTGITTNLSRRLQEHDSSDARGAKALRGKRPVKLVFSDSMTDRSSAQSAEYKIKQLSKQEKEQLVSGELALTTLLE